MTYKSISLIVSLLVLLFLNKPVSNASSNQSILSTESVSSFPDSIECIVQPHYRFHRDGKPGREIIIKFRGSQFSGKGVIETDCPAGKDIIQLDISEGIDQYSVLLPPGVGVDSDCVASVVLRSTGHKLVESVLIPAKRKWTVYIYPHSHVDIGYTNTHANVEIIHTRNLINGIELAKKTEGYPEGSRYLWNPEVLWPVERYLKKASPDEKALIVDAVQKGYLHLDAGYVHTNTSSSAGEELFEFFNERSVIQELTGKKIETLVQVDIPGMSWGIVPVAADLGIRYCFALNNGSGRVGLSTELSFKPFWWLGPDGKSKILFMQPGSYTPGALAKGHLYWPDMAGQTDPSKLLQIVKTDHPRENFIDDYLAEQLPILEKADYYPYDIFPMTWAMADNTPIDADLPEAVKSWNEEYAFPHLIIASATEIMKIFEEKYGDQLPVRKGDFTEYWTDGLGTAAKQTGMNRASKERLIQTETLWAMLHHGEAPPRSDIDEAWRNVIMGTEHTWCFMDPNLQPITNDILNVKFGYFQKAEDMSKSLLLNTLSKVSDQKGSVIAVFNTLSWQRSGLVYISAKKSDSFRSVCDENGETVLSQRLSTGELAFFADEIPAFGSRNYYLKEKKGKSKSKIKLAKGNILDNGIVKVMIDQQTGDISSLSTGDYEFVDTKAKCSVNSYRYLHGDDTPDKATGTKDVTITIKENGPLLASVLVKSDAEGCRSLSREITIVSGQASVEIKNIVDKIAIMEKEGVHFGFAFNISSPVTKADIPWGIMELENDQLPEANRNWIAFQRWLDISNEDKGITFCSLDAPVFETGTMTANIQGMATDSPEWIRKLQPSATIYSWALNNHWFTNFPLSQEGKIQFRYRILPHNTKYNAAFSNRFGMEQSQPLIVTPVKSGYSSTPVLKVVGSDDVVVSIIKTNDDGKKNSIRLRSTSDKDELVRLVWPARMPAAVYIDNSGVKQETGGEFFVPAMGFVTLVAIW
jgi:alpha-mannosidase